MGPTASGKTALAMQLHDLLPCEIISVDSVQVYKGLDIGTAKPHAQKLRSYPHHLIDIREPEIPYSVAEFRRDALLKMQNIVAKGSIPLLVGGSMLYFKALTQGIAELPPANKHVRCKIDKIACRYGWSEIHNRLAKVDPETSRRLHANDSQRLQRAMEVYILTGKTLTAFHEEQVNNLPYHYINIAIAPGERKFLHEQIAQRCQQMFESGFIDEVRQLRARGTLNLHLPSMRSVGYRQAWEFLESTENNGEIENLIEKCVIATRQLAKKQLTWLKSWRNVSWFDSLSETLLADVMSIVSCFSFRQK
ncbi:MAG: tRNA (adenosine(37)-N6)-dimethylallyltransferase MiaA [Endozoicomonadaceae bacterium]|nr:tRNA (adenosine(37)-N6)-dimethylallyltransferase MiaA [Endozoicomonadaceae bacterium]